MLIMPDPDHLFRVASQVVLNQYLKGPELGMCRAPYWLKDQTGLDVRVMCGKCLPCRRRRRENLVGRFCAECETVPSAQIMSLTYRDESLPDVVEPDWIESQWHGLRNRLWRRLGRFRYITVAQLGEHTGRFHFHVIVIPLDPAASLPVGKDLRPKWVDPDGIWPHGHRIVDEVNPKSVGYCVNYLTTANGKGTVRHWKSQKVGEPYFVNWLQNGKRYPIEPACCFPVEIDGTPKWFPMDRKFRAIADDHGYQPQYPNDQLQYLDWIGQNGLAADKFSMLQDVKNQAEAERRARAMRKAPEHPDLERLRHEIEHAGRRPVRGMGFK